MMTMLNNNSLVNWPPSMFCPNQITFCRGISTSLSFTETSQPPLLPWKSTPQGATLSRMPVFGAVIFAGRYQRQLRYFKVTYINLHKFIFRKPSTLGVIPQCKKCILLTKIFAQSLVMRKFGKFLAQFISEKV